ncbi:hypothetical protein SDC9_138612 [bioreactor metagenome]|uniref:Uncharacterized protein n=1 Tax=bioreactor metagenome TaxID=1076179 RepID=A0A645DQA8_9ZZZZ
MGQTQHGVVLHIGHRAAGHVVQVHGQIAHGLGNRLEMLVLAFLARLVVVGHDLQLAVGTHALGKPCELDGLGRRVGTATSHHRNAACSLLHGHADDLAVLFHVDGGRFAGRADHAQARRALGDMPVDQFAQRGVVHTAVFLHGGDQGDDAAGQGSAGRSHVRIVKRERSILTSQRRQATP